MSKAVEVKERVVFNQRLVATPGTRITAEQAKRWGIDPKSGRQVRTAKVDSPTEARQSAQAAQSADSETSEAQAGTRTETKPQSESYPVHKGGGYYELSNGETVRGKDDAIEAQAELDAAK